MSRRALHDDRVRAVQLGERVDSPAGFVLRAIPACTVNSGRWLCVTHRKAFPNQLMKDSHITDDAVHVLAWICDEHGPEVP